MSARGAPSTSPSGGGVRCTIASSTSSTPSPVLAADDEDLVGLGAGELVHLELGLGHVRRRQVDLVEHRDDLEVVLDRQVGVGHRLRLDALGGVDDQHGALAGRQAARHLVGEVDVAGRVDQVELVALSVARVVHDAHRLRLDRDAALALEVHLVEELLLHVARHAPCR